MNTDSARVQIQEGAYTFSKAALHTLLLEFDRILTEANAWMVITRTDDLITKTEFYSDAAKTKKIFQREYSRVEGQDGLFRVSAITTTFYNDDSSQDSQINHTLTRDGDDIFMNESASPFSTSEESTP